MKDISQFKDIHKGETILFVGNGDNLALTPPEWFDYPSIGVNEIHLYKDIFGIDWKPNYFTMVDRKNVREYGNKILEDFKDIPKFVPSPRMDNLEGENIFRFKNIASSQLWPKNNLQFWQDKDKLATEPIMYANITHIGVKLAYYMGASTILIIGMQHKIHRQDRHFYGINLGMSADQDHTGWFKGYKILSEKLAENDVQLINISEDTYVSEEIIKTDSYKNWLPIKEKRKIKNG